MENFSFKEFERVSLKATQNMRIGERDISPGETIIFLDKVNIAGFNDIRERVAARGGYHNQARVWWNGLKEQQLTFSQGVMNDDALALLTNSRIGVMQPGQAMWINAREKLESDENGVITLSHIPTRRLFLYNKSTGEKINDYTQNQKEITITTPYTDVIVDYDWDYVEYSQCLQFGKELDNSYVELEGFTRLKDDETGQIVSAVFFVPKLKLMSGLSIMLGAKAGPVMANFSGTALPVGSSGNSYVSEMYILGEKIEYDS